MAGEPMEKGTKVSSPFFGSLAEFSTGTKFFPGFHLIGVARGFGFSSEFGKYL